MRFFIVTKTYFIKKTQYFKNLRRNSFILERVLCSSSSAYSNFSFYVYLYRSLFIPNKMFNKCLLERRWDVTLFYDYFYHQRERYIATLLYILSNKLNHLWNSQHMRPPKLFSLLFFKRRYFLNDTIKSKH